MPESLDVVAAPPARGKVVEAVLRLGRAAHKSTIYPTGHPAVPGAVRHFVEALIEALEDRPALSLGIARDRILVDGEPIEGKNHVLSWLAEHLHDRGIGALELSREIPEGDGVRFVEWMAGPDPGREGGGEPQAPPEFQGIHLTRFDFARIRFGEDPTADPETRNDAMPVWHALMAGLIGRSPISGLPGAGEGGPLSDDPEAMARASARHSAWSSLESASEGIATCLPLCTACVIASDDIEPRGPISRITRFSCSHNVLIAAQKFTGRVMCEAQ